MAQVHTRREKGWEIESSRAKPIHKTACIALGLLFFVYVFFFEGLGVGVI